MEPEDRKLLKEIHELAKKNSKILRKIERRHYISLGITSLKWIIIIIGIIWSISFVQPYIVEIREMYKQIQETANNVNNFKLKADDAFNNTGLHNILDTFKINGY
jgi:hypothetical protein